MTLVATMSGLLLALVACAEAPPKPHYQPTQVAQADKPPYSCRLFYDEQKKCAFGACDKQTLVRLHDECLRDGGRP
jgi:hypothetical protein